MANVVDEVVEISVREPAARSGQQAASAPQQAPRSALQEISDTRHSAVVSVPP